MDPFRKKMLLLLIGHHDPESAIEDQEGEDEGQEDSGISQGPQSLRKANQDPDFIVRKKKKGGM